MGFRRHDTVEIVKNLGSVNPEIHGECGDVLDSAWGLTRVILLTRNGEKVFWARDETLNLVWSAGPFKPPTLFNRIVWGHLLESDWDDEQETRLRAAGYEIDVLKLQLDGE